MKKFLLIISFIVTAIGIEACGPGYVTSQPNNYNQYRPQSPSPSHIWIEGNWTYNRQTRGYNQNNGHWESPRKGRSYQQGAWRSNKRGYSWSPGRWR